MKYLVHKRNIWWGTGYFRVADGEDNEVFRIAIDRSHRYRPRLSRLWTLQDTFGNPITVMRRASVWRETFVIERVGEVIATIQTRQGRGKPRFEILLATGARLLASRNLNGKKYEVCSAEGQPFCRLEHPWFSHDRIVEVEAGADLLLAFSVIACFIQLQEIGNYQA